MNEIVDRREKIVRGLSLALIISLSFALGYLFADQASKAPIIIEQCT